MKTNSILKTTFSLLLLAFTISSCVKDDDFDTPNVDCNDSELLNIPATSMKTFEYVATRYFENNETLFEFSQEDDAIYFEGYVTSNDLKGNFYKELFIQDSRENPTYALKLGIDVRSLYTKYPIGTKLVIKLNGLAIDISHGELTLGKYIGGSIDEMRETIALSHVLRSCDLDTITPIELNSASEINDGLLGKFIQLNNAQFHVSVVGQTYVDINDNFDSHKDIVFCSDNSILKLETSSFAAYTELSLPNSKFNITGILSRDYGDDFYVLKINSNEDIEFLDSPRCDPLFNEDFDSGTDNTVFDFEGWTNFAEIGSELWSEQVYQGNGTVEFSAFQSGDAVNVGWLITPEIDIDIEGTKYLSFKTQHHHLESADNTLEVYISTNFDGTNVLGATWDQLNANIVTQDDSWYTFINSGLIDITDHTGTIHIAFKYTGSGTDTDLDGAYQIEDLNIIVE